MSFNIKNLRFLLAMFSLLAALNFTACKLEDLDDPNNPSATVIEANATIAEIQNVVDGIQAAMRNNLPIYFDGVGVIGREFYRFSGSDPRYTQDLLGGANSVLDPGGFYTTNPYASRYRTIRNCTILENALVNTTSPQITEGQKVVARGFSKTIRAHELLLALNQQWDNGIRTDVANPDALGPFLSKDASLDAIQRLLTEANADLGGSAAFPFKLRGGFTGFATPADFNKFNRALAARVAAYRGQWDACLTNLSGSFLNAAGDFGTGCYYIYSKSGGDVLNEMFQSPTATGEIRIVHPSFLADAEAGDTRLSKAFKRAETASQGTPPLSGDYGVSVYASNTTPISIIRNEELILLSAEANAQKGGANLAAAVTALNVVRNHYGLPNFASNDQAAIITEMLKQRRYSLFAEGHRWVDMRRYNRLNELPIDRAGDDVWDKFPRPTNE